MAMLVAWFMVMAFGAILAGLADGPGTRGIATGLLVVAGINVGGLLPPEPEPDAADAEPCTCESEP